MREKELIDYYDKEIAEEDNKAIEKKKKFQQAPGRSFKEIMHFSMFLGMQAKELNKK